MIIKKNRFYPNDEEKLVRIRPIDIKKSYDILNNSYFWINKKARIISQRKNKLKRILDE